MAQVHDNPTRSRFEMTTPAGLAIADYRISGSIMTIYHTEVPVPLRGQGHGARLVIGALRQARQKGYKVVPSCWFVRDVMQAFPEFADLRSSCAELVRACPRHAAACARGCVC
jgi:predicted GNAT family acetyltransferase